MSRILLYTILVVLLFVRCNHTTVFVKLDHLTKRDYNIKAHNDYVVISNPPEHRDSLYIEIMKYVKDESLNTSFSVDQKFYNCFFYKESRNTPKDYHEKDPEGGFSSDIIAHHLDDLIAVLKYSEDHGWKCKIKTHNNPDSWKYYRNISLE